MAQTIFLLIILILVFDYLLGNILDLLNIKHYNNPLPNELSDIYEPEKYLKSVSYEKENLKFGFITGTFNMIIILLVLVFGGFAWLDSIIREHFENNVLISLLFFGIIAFVSDIINTPFSVYDTFVIEEKYGFNKTTSKTFIFDKLKGWLLMFIIGVPILSVVIWFYYETTNMFWLYGWALVSGFSVFMAMFYSNLIVPLFNKQTPLQEGELRDAIRVFSEKAGFKLKNIYVIDGSKRSTKANAYFTGLGAKKRIVLYDTLINDLTVNEIVAVLAHEIGHYKKKHTLMAIISSIVQTGITFYLLSLFISIPEFSYALGGTVPSFHIGIIAFGVLFSPISMAVGLVMNIFSRKNEYAADRFAGQYNLGSELIAALKKLSVKNLSNINPHPLYVFFHYSHPTLLQRIKALA